jgi:hypothetical protein
MSQGAVEATLGRLLCDDAFRQEFFEDAETATARAGLRLTAVELGSLQRIGRRAIEQFVGHLDDRVRRVEDRLLNQDVRLGALLRGR